MIEKIYKLINYPSKLHHKIDIRLQKKMLYKCGSEVRFGRNVNITWHNCTIGNDVYIGDNATFLCTDAPLEIGNHVMFGPNCTIITGDHRVDLVGKYMSTVIVSEKKMKMICQ